MKLQICSLVLTLAAGSSAQWTVVTLSEGDAAIFGVHSGQQVGQVNSSQAVMWAGTPGSMINLTPTGFQARANGAANEIQVGQVGNHASLWTGTAESWVDLHPAVADLSSALGVGDGQQVGSARINNEHRASLWEGTAASWINLEPAGSLRSAALGASVGTQVGYVDLGGINRASLWTGTPGTWVDLTPAGFPTGSIANGVHGIHQVGTVSLNGSDRASLWTGTAASWVDLSPAGSNSSYAHGVSYDRQAGSAGFGDEGRAGIWTSTASSWVDLHAYLPAHYVNSSARGIWTDAGVTYVVGYGRNVNAGLDNALMWVSRAVAPASYSLFRGTVFSGNLASLLSSDGNKLTLRPGVVLTSGEPPVQLRLNGTAPTASPSAFSFSVEANASFAFAQQKISLWNYVTGAYEVLDTRLAKVSDDTVTVTVSSNPQRFIQAGTLAVRTLVSYKAVGPALVYPWSGRIDKVWWTFPG